MAKMRGKPSMGLDSLLQVAFPGAGHHNSNSTADRLVTLSPTTLLETFVPGYGPIHTFLLLKFGFDVTVVVSLGFAFYLGNRILRSVWAVLWSTINKYYMAEITVASTDEIHEQLIGFLAHQYKISSSRHLMAETPRKSAWEVDNEEPVAPETTVPDAYGNIKWLNFSNQEAKTQPRFTPAIGSHNFWHKGTYFQLRRKEVTMFEDRGSGTTSFKEKELLTLSCFGRSTEPIKELIQHSKAHYHQGHNAKTVIKRPMPKDMRRYGGRGSWFKVAERPCRPMRTVVLDESRKMDVLADINEYLNPATARWYANRGIPYRRGYLFYGPPGTGKTSLSCAIAGVFGLDIHVVSLLEPTLTEEDLGLLFTTLPARCIVLLEDIDTAGLVRTEPSEGEEKNQEEGRGKEDISFKVEDLTKALKKANQQREDEKKKGISLSGLLNIIDGVASHEGRVLVMTTNHPEKLDEALIRPGRVDHQVAFSNASQGQIKELFERMYANDLSRTKIVSSTTQATTTSSLLSVPKPALTKEEKPPPTPPATPVNSVNSSVLDKTQGINLSPEDLSDISRRFAERIPDDMFSPAEIQGFLLKRKTEPTKALREVEGWVNGMIEQKKKGTKLVTVQ